MAGSCCNCSKSVDASAQSAEGHVRLVFDDACAGHRGGRHPPLARAWRAMSHADRDKGGLANLAVRRGRAHCKLKRMVQRCAHQVGCAPHDPTMRSRHAFASRGCGAPERKSAALAGSERSRRPAPPLCVPREGTHRKRSLSHPASTASKALAAVASARTSPPIDAPRCNRSSPSRSGTTQTPRRRGRAAGPKPSRSSSDRRRRPHAARQGRHRRSQRQRWADRQRDAVYMPGGQLCGRRGGVGKRSLKSEGGRPTPLKSSTSVEVQTMAASRWRATHMQNERMILRSTPCILARSARLHCLNLATLAV